MALVNESQKEFLFGVLEDLSPDLCFYKILLCKMWFMSHPRSPNPNSFWDSFTRAIRGQKNYRSYFFFHFGL